MKIYFITNKTASRVWRMLPQARLMQQFGHEVQIDEYSGQIDMAKIAWADIVVSEMVFDFRILYAIEDTNKKLIYEVDDIQEVTHKKHYAYKDTSGLNGWKRRVYLYIFMAKCDAIIVTNEKLRRRYQWLKLFGKKKTIYTLPNYMDLTYWDKPTTENNTGKIRILWAGGSSHKVDIEYIKPVLKRIFDKYKNVVFVHMGFGGWSSADSPFVEFDRGEHVLKGLPREQMRLEQGVAWAHYPEKLAMQQCDIGIAPVVKNYFAEHKTPIKAMEYGINKMPCVASKFLYKDAIIDGKTGFLAETQEEFYEHLCKLIEDEKLRREMGEAAYKHVTENFDITKHINKWKQVFETVLTS